MIISDDFLNKSKAIFSMLSAKDYAYSCPEMDYRECARTSYYYIYHIANRRALQIDGPFDRNVGQHQRVINKLLQSDDDSDQKLGELLALMKAVRVKADYTLEYDFSKNEAYKVLRRAERLFDVQKQQLLDSATLSDSDVRDSTA